MSQTEYRLEHRKGPKNRDQLTKELIEIEIEIVEQEKRFVGAGIDDKKLLDKKLEILNQLKTAK